MKKIHSGYLKSVLLWVIVFVLTLAVSMGGAYAYFTATATQKQATATTGVIRVKFNDNDPTIGVVSGNAVVNNAMIVPGSVIYYSGTVINDGTVGMWAVLECSVYVDDMTTPVQTEFYQVNGDSSTETKTSATKVIYDSTADDLEKFQTSATQIAYQSSKTFAIKFQFSTAYDNSYLKKSAQIVITAHAIQESHVTGVQATNLLLQGKVPTGGGVISLLPTGYTQLEYISTTGSDYFDTGIDILSVNAIESPAVEIKYNTSKTQTWIFGQRSEADDYDEFGLYISSDTSFLVRTERVNKTCNYTTTGTHTVKMAVGNFECDGISSRDIMPCKESNGECSLAIGGMNTAGMIENECFVGDIYYCNLYVDDTIIHQYVPCKNASGQVGLYDVVTQTFIQSQNNKFTAGPAV